MDHLAFLHEMVFKLAELPANPGRGTPKNSLLAYCEEIDERPHEIRKMRLDYLKSVNLGDVK